MSCQEADLLLYLPNQNTVGNKLESTYFHHSYPNTLQP